MLRVLLILMSLSFSNYVFAASSNHCSKYLEHASSDVIYFNDFWTIDDAGLFKIDQKILGAKFKDVKFSKENGTIKIVKPASWGGLGSPKVLEINVGSKGEVTSMSTYRSTKTLAREDEDRIEFKYKDGVCYPNEERKIQDKWIGTLRPTFNLELCNELRKLDHVGDDGMLCKCDNEKVNKLVAGLLDKYNVAPFYYRDKSKTNSELVDDLAKSQIAKRDSKVTQRAFELLGQCKSVPGAGDAFEDKRIFGDAVRTSQVKPAGAAR